MSAPARDRFFTFLVSSFLVATFVIHLNRPKQTAAPVSAEPAAQTTPAAPVADSLPAAPVDTADITITLELDSEKLEDGSYSDWIRLIHVYDRSGKKLQTLNPGDNAPWTFERDLGISRCEIEDMNFDGHDDFRLLNGLGSRGQHWFTFFLYNPATKKFAASTAMEGLCDVTFDHKTKTVFSNVRFGCCREHNSMLMAWENGALVLLKEEDVTEDLSDTTGNTAIVKLRRRVNGQLQDSTLRANVNDHLVTGAEAWWFE